MAQKMWGRGVVWWHFGIMQLWFFVLRSSGSKSSMQPCACMDEHEWCVQPIGSEMPARKQWQRSSEVCQALPFSASMVWSMEEQKGKGRIRAVG